MAINMMCMNSKCKHYWEDNCMRNINEERIQIGEDGKCETFEKGVCELYNYPAGEYTSCDEHFNKIDINKAQNSRIELKKYSRKIETKYICPVCKNEDHIDNANYCKICGNKIIKEQTCNSKM